MKIQLRSVVNSLDALKEFANIKFKASITFELAKVIKSANLELEAYEAARINAVKANSSDGQNVDEDKIPVFLAEMNELSEKEIDLYDYRLPVKELEDKEFSATQLMQLEWLINSD